MVFESLPMGAIQGRVDFHIRKKCEDFNNSSNEMKKKIRAETDHVPETAEITI